MMKPEGRGEWTHKLCDLGIPGGCVIATYQPRGLLVWFDLDIRKHHSFNWMFGRWTFIFIFHPCYDPDGQGQTGNQLAAGHIMYWSSKYWRVPRCPSQFWVSRLWPAPLPNVFGSTICVLPMWQICPWNLITSLPFLRLYCTWGVSGKVSMNLVVALPYQSRPQAF